MKDFAVGSLLTLGLAVVGAPLFLGLFHLVIPGFILGMLANAVAFWLIHGG